MRFLTSKTVSMYQWPHRAWVLKSLTHRSPGKYNKILASESTQPPTLKKKKKMPKANGSEESHEHSGCEIL